jgi:hypothetical protein
MDFIWRRRPRVNSIYIWWKIRDGGQNIALSSISQWKRSMMDVLGEIFSYFTGFFKKSSVVYLAFLITDQHNLVITLSLHVHDNRG